ncbi:hypothetical protein [Billgrantia gudaonensis]|uniref:DNA-binding transcriptional activator of the SARP family n=1 Tax=Billgrantia gudaonensis TaxID=376427 RepID=A0A1G8V263_9GAMM|nr:hypothetical protein [Halomonas gudaonensis]SDJ59250.1 DNA-binding transcriptional activator of the SARP family [Halomonas gudaonensis]
MSALTLNLLGDLEVIRDGQAVPLPPSKKTRALLAYLALHARPFSREHLCDLLWELPDDPRGSLRWSLSKLRRLVDDPGHPRLIADRLSVSLDTRAMDIDVNALHAALDTHAETSDPATLEAIAARYRGPFLEGLDLANLHDFHSWCLAERERALRAQTTLLAALVERLATSSPERALPHAYALVRLSPFDEKARAKLIELLLTLRRPRAADHHFQQGLRLLKQAGIASSGALLRARRGTAAQGVTASPYRSAEVPPSATQPATTETVPDLPWEDRMEAALERLAPDVREVLDWAAVLSPRLDAATLGRVSGLDDAHIGAALEVAERLQFLEATEGGLRFSHERVAHRLYAGISVARRQLMHRHLAERLAQDPALELEHADDLAHHARLSGDPELATRALVTAGRLCLRFCANEQAQRLAQEGIAQAERLSGGRRLCLLLELHEVLLSAAPLDDWEATAETLVMLAERALEHGALAHARLGYQLASHLRWAHGQWANAREEALQSERVTRSADDTEQIIAMAETAKCLAMLERDLDQARAMLADAQKLATQRRLSHPALPMAEGLLAWHADRQDEAETHFKEARTLCKAGGDRLGEFQANESLMMMAVEHGRFDDAQARCAVLAALGERLRDGSEAPFAHAAQGLCHYALTDDAAPLEAALGALRDADAKHRLAWLLNRTARLDLQRARPAAAVMHAREALACAQTLERASEQWVAHRLLVEAHRALDELAAARSHAADMAALDQAPVALWARRGQIAE